MTDERSLERIEELEGGHMDNAVLQIRSLIPTGMGPEFCEECGNDIPEMRRAGGYRRCVGCVEVEEAHKRHMRGLGVRS